ncbi:MAG: DUF1800 family protein [Bacteroidota bacterium]
MPDASRPWTPARARHLVRRMRIGAPADVVAQVFAEGPAAAVTRLLNEAQTDTEVAEPAWYADVDSARTGQHRKELQQTFIRRLITHPVNEAMALFWHDHFVTDYRAYNSSIHGFQYTNRLRRNAFGNFRTFVEEIGLDLAMLRYLNGHNSHKNSPNENYARELLELFTMGILDKNGQPNYDESEIQTIAKALTGYVARHDYYEPDFVSSRHDDSVKIIFGQEGQWGHADVMRIIFEERPAQIAHFISAKLYAHFVDELTPNEAVIDAMAALFVSSGWNIRTVAEALLKSRHFYDETFIGGRIRGPMHFYVGHATEHLRYRNAVPSEDECEDIRSQSRSMEQDILAPPNVAGWPGGRTWISESGLIERDKKAASFIKGRSKTPQLDPMPLLDYVSDADDPYVVVQEIHDMLLPVPLPQPEQDLLYDVLLDGLPPAEWRYDNSKPERLRDLLTHLRQRPENHLF